MCIDENTTKKPLYLIQQYKEANDVVHWQTTAMYPTDSNNTVGKIHTSKKIIYVCTSFLSTAQQIYVDEKGSHLLLQAAAYELEKILQF